ncbi:Glutamate receptor 2.2 [Morella rubra]|uniref:Glutamate receptor 2.2 n=1 Tax=Morella rubra TaxID=262757 RepID=A0A6A1WMC9_9ROSI|nr:Glutamate receptor 2.2 [Morella rubra]
MYKAVKAHSRPFFFIFQRSVVLSGIHTLDGWHLDVQALLVVISDDRPGGAWGPTRAWISRASTFSDLAGLSPLAAGPATIFHHRLSFSAGQLSLLPFVGFSPFMGLYLSFWAWVCKAAFWPICSLARRLSGGSDTPLRAFNVGVLLDMDTWFAKMGLSCINMALSDFYASRSHYKTRLVLHVRDSKSEVDGAAAADCLGNASNSFLFSKLNSIPNEKCTSASIIRPQNSMQAKFVIDLGEKAQVHIISFSATSPSLTSLRSSYFFRVAQNDSSQVKAINAIIEAFGWREAVPIYVHYKKIRQ